MDEKVKITFKGSKGKPVTVEVKGIDEQGKIVFKLKIPKEDRDFSFQELLATIFTEVLSSARIQIHKHKNAVDEEDMLNQIILDQMLNEKRGEA